MSLTKLANTAVLASGYGSSFEILIGKHRLWLTAKHPLFALMLFMFPSFVDGTNRKAGSDERGGDPGSGSRGWIRPPGLLPRFLCHLLLYEPYAGEPPGHQVPQKGRPRGAFLGGEDGEAQDLSAAPSALTPVAMTVHTLNTRPPSRQRWVMPPNHT